MQWNEFRSHISQFTARQQQHVKEAFDLGKKMHGDQKRMSGEAYFSHPIAVADMLADMGADPDTIIAALLHDTIEDTPLTLKEIENIFGESVGALIEGVTKLSAADVAEQPNLNEQVETLRKIFTLMEKDVRIMVIKLIDRLHNMQTAEFLSREKQAALAQETYDVFVKIADRLCMQDVRDELEGLSLSILQPDLFEKVSRLREKNELHGDTVIKVMRQKIAEQQPQTLRNLHMLFEAKSWDKGREQMEAEGTTITGVSATTVVFLAVNTDDCYRILGQLHQFWKREILSFQDFINTPSVNGYRGLHTTLLLEDGTRVRCKIRTQEMHEYARKGITTHCFKSKEFGLLHYLPWAERISTLSQDTEGKSSEFWQSLQSDILGESIVIYGPGDQGVTVPKGSTALDGAFYMFHKEALKTQSISIGGKSVSLSIPLQHSHSLNISLGDEPLVQREWLGFVKTGLATAMIRTALAAGKPEAEKISLGKELIQQELSIHQKGFIEEFKEENFRSALLLLGYSRLDDLYIAIADGRIQPHEAYLSLFEQKQNVHRGSAKRFRMTYRITMANAETMDRVSEIHRRYRHGLSDLRYKKSRTERLTVFIAGSLSPDEQENLQKELVLVGAEHLKSFSFSGFMASIAGIVLLISLWGLDPVFARILLQDGLTAVDLTIIRFATVWGISALIYGFQRLFFGKRLKKLNPFSIDLLFCGLALFITGFFTYLTLSLILPVQYIFFIIGGVLVSALAQHRRYQMFPALVILGGALAMLGVQQGWSPMGFLFGLVSGTGFALYSYVSKRYQEERAFVRARYPAFLFWVSLVGMILSLGLIPFTSLGTLQTMTIAKAVLFSAVFIYLPYILYFEYMRRMKTIILNHTLPFVCLATIAGEVFLTHSTLPLIGLALPIVFVLQFAGLEKSQT
ncbi:MAG: HD domain-containing protein [Candidatus Peribacteraceae bacterium]|nr:HD domain-containing protein [Candidatus Peribacteraceae bacterium]